MALSLRQQLLLGAVLLASTAVGIRNIAAARNEAAVGGRTHRLETSRSAEMRAFEEILQVIEGLARAELAERLRALQRDGRLWIAPGLGGERWALYVETFGWVKRIYLRDVALIAPERHLFPEGAPAITPERRRAFAQVSLAGALYHELQHWDGEADEARAYDREIAWLESLRAAPPGAASDAGRRALDWGIESATLSARKARAVATGSP